MDLFKCCFRTQDKPGKFTTIVNEYPFGTVALVQNDKDIPSLSISLRETRSMNAIDARQQWLNDQTSFHQRLSLDVDTKNKVINEILDERRANAGLMFNAKVRLSKSLSDGRRT